MNLKLSHTSYHFLKWTIWIFYGVYLGSFFFQDHNFEMEFGVILFSIIIQMTLISFLNNWYRLSRPTLLDWFRLTTFYVLGLNFLTIAINIEDVYNFFGYVLLPSEILSAVLTIIFGLIGLKVGEILFTNWKFKSSVGISRDVTYDFRSPGFFFIFSIIISFVLLFFLLTGQIGYGTLEENSASNFSFLFQVLFSLSTFILSTLAVFKYLYGYKKKHLTKLFIFYFLMQILLGFLSGMKESVIVPIIIVLVPYLLSSRKVPRRIIYLGLFGVLLIYPLNDNYRSVLNDYPKIEKGKAFGMAIAKTSDLSLFDNVSNGGGKLSNRLSLFPYLVYSVENESKWKYYKSMDRYIYLPISWIVPRFIIPEKPKSNTGTLLNEMVFGFGVNSITPSTYGWSFFEGGYIYVFISFLIFGFFITYFEGYLESKQLFPLLMYVAVIITLLKVESDIYFLINSIIQRAFVYFICIRIFIKSRFAL
jgi:hypothetical protein